MPSVVYNPERLKKPLLRSGTRGSGDFKEISWPEALDMIAEQLQETGRKYGKQAILPLGGSGACRGMLHHTHLLSTRFFNGFGGYTETSGSYSGQAAAFTESILFGSAKTGFDKGTLKHSGLIILWGANIADTRYGCEMETRIQEQKKRGIPVIVIDPRKTETATRLGTEWIPVYPGTDSVLMAAVLYVLLRENLVNSRAINALSNGFEKLEQYILGHGFHI